MAKKEEVINKYGQWIRMNEAARRIAEEHYGVNKPRPVIKEVPQELRQLQELLQLPKRIDITKAIETIEVPKVKPVKIVTIKAEEPTPPVKKPVRKPVKKSK